MRMKTIAAFLVQKERSNHKTMRLSVLEKLTGGQYNILNIPPENEIGTRVGTRTGTAYCESCVFLCLDEARSKGFKKM